MPSELKENLAAIEIRIAGACHRSGRARGDVTLIAVSKTFPASAIDEALDAGISDIGENRVQEFRGKIEDVSGRGRWHLIGHLQSNKVKDAVRLFDVIQSVDSLPLAQRVAREAESQEKLVDVFLEINIGQESQKSGVLRDEASQLASQVAQLSGVTLRGLMAIPPLGNEAETRDHFRHMRELHDQLRRDLEIESLTELSMGMSEDFELAIEEGSTMVRLGRAIFGQRGER